MRTRAIGLGSGKAQIDAEESAWHVESRARQKTSVCGVADLFVAASSAGCGNMSS
jgi:hypothetical protein